MDSPPQNVTQLQPRLRHLLTFGDVLDESMLLFRMYWLTFAVVSGVALLPPGLLLVWLSGAGFISRSLSFADLQNGALSTPAALNAQLAQLVGVAIYLVVYAAFGLLWSAAVILTTAAYVRGEKPALGRIYRPALRRYGAVLVSTLVFGAVSVLLWALGALLFVVTLFGIVGSLVAIVGLLFWWLRPSARRTWLKWLIILTAPFGLPTYFAARWALYVAAAVLEHRGPIDSLRRSGELATSHWFRVAAILMVASLIVGVMLSVLSAFVTVPFTIAALFRGELGLNPTEAAISSAVTFIIRILLTSIGSIVYTVLFLDLRNRREGTDIGERVSQLEASALPANG